MSCFLKVEETAGEEEGEGQSGRGDSVTKGMEGNFRQPQGIQCLGQYNKRQGVAWQGWGDWRYPRRGSLVFVRPKRAKCPGKIGQAQRGRAL